MTNSVLVKMDSIPAMAEAEITKVRQMETLARQAPQVDIQTQHLIHAGMYARTVLIPAGVMITGVLIKIPTILIVQGTAEVYVGEETRRLQGYNVLPAEAIRKQAFVAITDVYLTMLFPTDVADVDAAEREFTDEVELLITNGVNRENNRSDSCLA